MCRNDTFLPLPLSEDPAHTSVTGNQTQDKGSVLKALDSCLES